MSDDPIKDVLAAETAVDIPEDMPPPEGGGGDFAADLDPDPGPAPDPSAEAAEFIDLGGGAGKVSKEAIGIGSAFPLNDIGNGRRLLHYFGRDMIFVPRLGWYRWDGRRWVADEDEIKVRADAQKISALMQHEITCISLEDWQMDDLETWRLCRGEYRKLSNTPAEDMDDEQKARWKELEAVEAKGTAAQVALNKARSNHHKNAISSGNSNRIKNMLTEAKVGAATEVDALNRDPYMLNCENGVLHFTKGLDALSASFGETKAKWRVDLIAHDRDQKISKMVRAPYDAAAECPTFLAFLERVQPDPELRTFLQRWFGYSITGLTKEQRLVFFFGQGRNGKSTLVDTIAAILADYGTTIPIETLTGAEQRKGSDATPDLVRLPGARFVRASEPEQGQRMKEALIKALTGGEAIMIRRMHSEFVEIVPEFKLTISGNHKPEIRGADDGIWRRVTLVPWLEQIAQNEVDQDLPKKLAAEAPGILAWLVAGALDYLENGLPIPEVVQDATADYRKQSDPMRVFLCEQCTVTGAKPDFVSGRDLRDAFMAWQLSEAEKPWGARAIALAIRQRVGVVKGPNGEDYEPAKTNGDTGYRGLQIPEETMNRIAAYREQFGQAGGRG